MREQKANVATCAPSKLERPRRSWNDPGQNDIDAFPAGVFGAAIGITHP
jgi:hypothetical protein